MAANSPPTPAQEAELFGRDVYHEAGGDVLASPSGDLTTIEGRANLRQALHQRLIAAPGDLPWAPDYGVGLRKDVNKLITPSQIRRWRARIRAQLLQDDRISEIVAVSVTSAEGEAKITVSVTFRDVGSDGHRSEVFDI